MFLETKERFHSQSALFRIRGKMGFFSARVCKIEECEFC